MKKKEKQDDRASLDIRVAPTKENAKRTMEHLLVTGARLLEEVGFEGFNTNLLATAAGARIRTVYRYFPNKFAIITAIARRMSVEWAKSNEPFFQALEDEKIPLRKSLEGLLNGFIKLTSEQVGAMAVLQALSSTPALRELDSELFEQIAARMTQALTRRQLDIPPARLKAIASILTISSFAAVDLYVRLQNRREARTIWAEFIDMQASTLERYEKVTK